MMQQQLMATQGNMNSLGANGGFNLTPNQHPEVSPRDNRNQPEAVDGNNNQAAPAVANNDNGGLAGRLMASIRSLIKFILVVAILFSDADLADPITLMALGILFVLVTLYYLGFYGYVYGKIISLLASITNGNILSGAIDPARNGILYDIHYFLISFVLSLVPMWNPHQPNNAGDENNVNN